MTPTETKWLRVSRETPCLVCGRFDWCGISDDESAVVCMRVESATRTRNGGFLHKVVDTPRPREPRRVVLPIRSAPPDLYPMAVDYQHAAAVDRLHDFGASLNVRTNSLIAFGVGWASNYPAWSFPMIDPTNGNVTGIRLRPPVGKKFSVRGSKEALFLPDTMTPADEVLLILEGETDAIAGHGIGFNNAVGRPSCAGGTTHLIALVKNCNPTRVVVVRDNDEPGVRGAEALASTLALYAHDVRVIAPPDGVKDLRAWTATGATRHDLERLIRAADARRLNLHFTTKGTT